MTAGNITLFCYITVALIRLMQDEQCHIKTGLKISAAVIYIKKGLAGTSPAKPFFWCDTDCKI